MYFNGRPRAKATPPPRKKPMCVIISGLPGSGKGSLCKFLCEHYSGLFHLSTGEIFRGIANNPDHPLHDQIDELLENNQLIDDQTTYQVLLSELEKIPSEKILLLDGFPRTFEQALWFCKESKVQDLFNQCFGFRLDVKLEDCKHLMLKVRKRPSDTPEKVPARIMEESINLTMGVYPVLSNYMKLVKIEGYPNSLAQMAKIVANHLKLLPRSNDQT